MDLRSTDKYRRSALALIALLQALVFQLPGASALAGDAAESNELTAVMARFRPLKPTLVIDYDATYELLWVNLSRVATATIRLTEGLWHSEPSGTWDPACMVEFDVQTLQKTNEIENARLYINKRTVATLSMPNLQMIKYAKLSDERFRPYFGKNSALRFVEAYDFEAGALSYTRRDLPALTVTTNMPGIDAVGRQSRELADVMTKLNSAYQDKTNTASTNPCVMVHFSTEGAARTFGIYTGPERISLPILDRKVDTLHAEIKPEEKYHGAIKGFDMWCIPLEVLAVEMNDTNLQSYAEVGIAHAMLPVSGHYELFMGRITCTLTGMRTQTVESVTK